MIQHKFLLFSFLQSPATKPAGALRSPRVDLSRRIPGLSLGAGMAIPGVGARKLRGLT
jgi:hypothetical protein